MSETINQPSDPNAVTLFAQTNFRNQQRRFGIKLDDRRRHTYVIGKTGMGKTTLLENMILSDIYAGHGCCYVDPHGDTAEKIIDFIPSWRINDVVYFNPADVENPVGFNILETSSDEQKHLVASGLMGVFKKIWPDVWSARMEYILLNCVLALLDYPGATLLGITRLLVDAEFRERVIQKIRDPVVKTFWVGEFASWSEKYATEAVAPVQNKVGQFLSASIIRNIIAQVKSTIDPRKIMDEKKIFIVNLSKGRVGEDNMRLLGNMLIVKLQLAAMERVDIPEEKRQDFFLYVDEFQNFATPSFAGILSEARKYRLSLILAHQYIEQLVEEVRDAVFGNVGTLISFRVGAQDAAFMETEFMPNFTPEDLTSLQKFSVYLKLMVDGMATEAFSAMTLPPIAQRTHSAERVINVSRERYATPRALIEEKVLRWSGMEAGPTQASMHEEEDEPERRSSEGARTSGAALQFPVIESEEEVEMRREGEFESGDQQPAHIEYLRFSPERLAAIAKAQPSKKKDKPKFKHTCSRCGAVWEMPVQLDPTRPMFCADCLPIVREDKKERGKFVKSAVTGKVPDQASIEEVMQSRDIREPNALEKAMQSIEEGGKIVVQKKEKSFAPPQPNRPRIVVTDPGTLAEIAEEPDEGEDEPSELVKQIEETRGHSVVTQKRKVVPREQPVSEVSKQDVAPLQLREPQQQSVAEHPVRERQEYRTARFTETDEMRKKHRKRKPRERSQQLNRPSIEDHFASAEARFDERVSERSDDAAAQATATVFKQPSVAHSPQQMKPGQRIHFN